MSTRERGTYVLVYIACVRYKSALYGRLILGHISFFGYRVMYFIRAILYTCQMLCARIQLRMDGWMYRPVNCIITAMEWKHFIVVVMLLIVQQPPPLYKRTGQQLNLVLLKCAPQQHSTCVVGHSLYTALPAVHFVPRAHESMTDRPSGQYGMWPSGLYRFTPQSLKGRCGFIL